MAAGYRRMMEAFDPATEEWGRYIDRFQQFLVVNYVQAEETSSVLDNSDQCINLQAIGKSGVSGKTHNKEAGRIDRGIAASFSTQSDHNRRTIQIPSTQPSGRRIGDGLHG